MDKAMSEAHNIREQSMEGPDKLANIDRKLDTLFSMVSEVRETVAEMSAIQAHKDKETHDIWLKIDEQNKEINKINITLTEIKGTTTTNADTINRWVDFAFKVVFAMLMGYLVLKQ